MISRKVDKDLVTQNATQTLCGYEPSNEDRTIIALTVVLFSLQTIFFALRMLCRAVRIAPWGKDDTTIVIAFVSCNQPIHPIHFIVFVPADQSFIVQISTLGFLGASIVEKENGIGRDIWTLTPQKITDFLKVFFVFEMIYTFTLGMVKISICFLYLRIFPGRNFCRIIYATQVFNVAVIITFAVANGLQCHPISHFWESWQGEKPGHCINFNAIAWGHAIVNIALDIWMLILPATQVWHLNVSWKKRAGILAMFGFGILYVRNVLI